MPQDREGRARQRKALPYPVRTHRAGCVSKALTGLSLIVLALSAAGCSMRSDLGFMTLMSEVPLTQAIIVPPPGGPAVIAVLQRRYQNGVTQEIALSTASSTMGQNTFYVSLVNDPETISEIDDTLKAPRLTQETVQTEMEERLPGLDMRTSLFYAQNKYGPFGFATGRSAMGDVCLYAWQQIEPNEPAILMTKGAISVRLRMCDAGATEEQLLRTMYNYTISAYFSSGAWNPYGSPPPPPAYLGQINAPVYPLGMAGPESVAASPRRALVSAPQPVLRSSIAPAQPIDKDTVPDVAPTDPSAPLTGYPVVPPPPPQ